MRRCVVTGIGVVSPLGCDLNAFWSRIKSGTSGIGRITRFDPTGFGAEIAGEVSEFNADSFIPKKEQRRMDLFCQYGLAAAKMAMADSGLDLTKENPERMGATVGSGIGGIGTLEEQHEIFRTKGPSRCSPFMIPQMISNMASGLIGIEFNLQGPNYSVVSACATAGHSIGFGLRHIQHDEADVIVAGGAEAGITFLAVAGFANMRALTTSHNQDPTRASRPFDKDRDGFVIAEGAAILVLEEYEHARARGAQIYCEVAGFGQTCDAHHITAPVESGAGATRAMKQAMKEAQLAPEAIQYINAHGTSTPLNDKTETRAIKGALGEEAARKVMISSSKSMTGHMLGAAAGIESVVCAMVLKHGIVSPTINYETPDPDCDLDYVPNVAREVPVTACLNNSLGFGGHNICLAFKKV